MTEPRDDDLPPDDPELRALAGFRDADDVGDLPRADEIDDLGSMTSTRIYQGDLEARPPDSDQPGEPPEENLESLEALELRAEETDDPNEAAEEGFTWVPPTDPPVIAGDEDPLEVAAGFGMTSLDEPYDADHHSALLGAEDERTARVLEALRADASTSYLADRIEIDTDGPTVIASGVVDDLDDEANVLAVISTVDGVDSIDNRISIRGL